LVAGGEVAARGVNGELAPVRYDDEEDADAMQKRSASLNTWSASPISSCNEVEVRLKTTAASATDGCIDLELLEMIGGVREMREEEENQLVPERGGAIPQGRRNRAGMPADTSGSDEKSRRSGNVPCENRKGGRGRRWRGLYSRGRSVD
jgi:hypothetical protein